MKLIDLFNQGGFIMYPLLVFSVLAWSIGLYKMYALWVFAKGYNEAHDQVKASLTNGKVNVAAVSTSPFITAPLQVVTSTHHASKDEMNERLYRRLAETNADLKGNLWVLGSISSSAPFIGLFGTVLGIMGSFKAIGTTGKSGFSVVAAGISESLVATAAGIIVAVVALLFYNYLQTRVNSIAQDFRLKCEEIGDLVFSSKVK
jgi:biopolymer transport protein ExbB/TolQ